MVLARERITQILKSHEYDEGRIPQELLDIAKSHETLRLYAVDITKRVISQSNQVSKEVMDRFLKLVPDEE